MSKSRGEEEMALHIRAVGLPAPQREYAFHPSRGWRFDFAWPLLNIAVEVEGVIGGAGGRHQRKDGYEADCEKYARALILGWKVLRVTPKQVRSGAALQWLEALIKQHPLLE